MYVNVKADITEASNLIEGFDKERPRIKKNLLRTSGQKTRSKVKKSYNSYLHKRSGNLYRSIHYSMYKNGKAVLVTVHTKEDKYRYGFALAHGYDVVPKNSTTLTFQVNGKWVRSYGVHVNSRDFVENPAERYLSSSEYKNDLDKKMDSEVKRIEKKYAKKN